ncbi:MAG: M28 family peptidase, partial [Thermoanaerobaculales bacterium]
VLLRTRGPDQELQLSFSGVGVARLEIPPLQAADQVVVAVMASPNEGAGFDRRTLLLRWGLAWVPRTPQDPSRDLLNNLLKKALPDGGAVARGRLVTTLDRLSGQTPQDGTGPVVQTRYAWAPEARAVLGVLQQEAGRRDLKIREQGFLRRAPNDIEQEWTNLLIDLPGTDQRRWPVVLAAHWDGARGGLPDSYLRALNLNDNASGVAVALEAAAAMSRMPHRAPILVAFLAGGYHEAAGAHALLDQLHGTVTAWVELDRLGIPDSWPRTANVYLEGMNKASRFPLLLTQPLKHVGLMPKPEDEIRSPHAGASLVAARRAPALVVSTRSEADPPDDPDMPVEVERDRLSPELLVLLTKALSHMVVELAGPP